MGTVGIVIVGFAALVGLYLVCLFLSVAVEYMLREADMLGIVMVGVILAAIILCVAPLI